MTRILRPAATILCLGTASFASSEALQITATPSHTATPTPTRTPTPTPTTTAGPVPSPMPTPWAVFGPEFLVPATPDGDQSQQEVAIGADNGFIVVWTDSDGIQADIGGRRFDAAGMPLADDFAVNNVSTGSQFSPEIASDDEGHFVVVWTSDDGSGDSDVRARRFGSDGSALGDEFVVNPGTTGDQVHADVAMDADRNFVVVWAHFPASAEQNDILGRRYNISGNPQGDPFVVSTGTGEGERDYPSVTMSPDGGFVVVWVGPGETGTRQVFGRGFDPEGNALGDEFPVGSSTLGERFSPDVAWIGSTPGFVTTFERSGEEIAGRLFRADLSPLGDEFRIDTPGGTVKAQPRVASTRQTGGPVFATFVVTWDGEDPADPGRSGIFAQRFSNAPFPTSAFFLANPPRRGDEYQVAPQIFPAIPAIAMDDRGQFVIGWSGDDGAVGTTIFARRFGFPDARAMQVDTVPSGGASNLNGVLEPGERVVVAPAWANPTISGSLPLQGTASNVTGPAGATYALDDVQATYGAIGGWQTNNCLFVQVDCYEVTVSSARPVQHWDATFDETLTSTGPLLGDGPLSPRTKTWALHIGGSFVDVPEDAFYPFIENVFHNRVTAGGGCGPGSFCGEEAVLRQQMAVFLLKSVYGAGFIPPEATGTMFDDVTADNPFAPWIEELAREEITAGCTAPPPPALPSYCPTAPVTRQQIAVFLLKTRFRSDYQPPACTGIFEDVSCGPGFPSYIEDLYSRGITGGCQTTPLLYCPAEITKRKQMAVFLVRTFPLELYGSD